MAEKQTFLCPDYYPDFHCKMGACRLSCCVGWPVSISMNDYFRLVGMDCSAALRRCLDCGLHVFPHASPERYAEITHRFDGNCHLRLPDGRCALHAESGESALPHICRLYPRAVRTEGSRECSCANSCERTCELLLDHPQPLAFIKEEIDIQLPETTANNVYSEASPLYETVRLHLISIIQDRVYPLPERLVLLGLRLHELEPLLAQEPLDEKAVGALLASPLPPLPALESPPSRKHLQFGLKTVAQLLSRIASRSASVHDYGEAVQSYFSQPGDAFNRYHTAKAHFESAYPQWATYFENLLVNHMFFSRFPFSDRDESMYERFLGLCSVYILMRCLCVGYLHDKADAETLIDVSAAAFRLIDHSPFHLRAALLLEELDCAQPERMFTLLNL